MYATATAPISLTLVNDGHGNEAIHLTGCSDIAKALRVVGSSKHEATGANVAEALRSLDTYMAGWFGEQPYTQSSRDNGCWTVETVEIKPCAAKMIKAAGVTFDAETGRPIDPTEVEAIPADLRGPDFGDLDMGPDAR